MNKIILAGVSAAALVAMVASASAADIYRRDAAPSTKDEVAPAFGWTGFYLGGHAGYGWGSADVTIPNYSANFTLDTSGFAGGGHIGYNLQRGTIVFGIEGDFSGSSVSGDHLSGLVHGNGVATPSDPRGHPRAGRFHGPFHGQNAESPEPAEKYNIDESWRTSVRGRLGLTITPDTLIYATGGAAWINVDTHYTPLAGGTKNDTLSGWIVGGGVERALTPMWSLRAEYLHAEYDTSRFVHNGPSDVSYQTDEVRGGVTLHLSRGASPLK